MIADSKKTKDSGDTKPWRTAKKEPAKPPNIAPMAKAVSLVLVVLMPSERQAISSSRSSASQARPIRHAAQADRHVSGHQAERQDEIEQEDLVIDRGHRQREGLGEVVGRADVEGPNAEDRRLGYAGNAGGTVGDFLPVDQPRRMISPKASVTMAR